MAAYPDLPYCRGSTRQQISGIQIVQMLDGTIKSKSYFDSSPYRFNLVHCDLTSAEVATFRTFYASYKDEINTLTWKPDSTVYDVRFTDKEVEESWIDGDYWDLMVELIGHPQ